MPIIYLSKVHDYITDEYYYSVDHHKDSIPADVVKFTWYVLKDTVDLYSVIALLQQTLSPVEINIVTYSYHSEYDMPLHGPIAPDVDLKFPYWVTPNKGLEKMFDYARTLKEIQTQGKIRGSDANVGDLLIDYKGGVWEVLKVSPSRKTITWRPLFYFYPKHTVERDYNELKDLRKPRHMCKFDKNWMFYHTQNRTFIALFALMKRK